MFLKEILEPKPHYGRESLWKIKHKILKSLCHFENKSEIEHDPSDLKPQSREWHH